MSRQILRMVLIGAGLLVCLSPLFSAKGEGKGKKKGDEKKDKPDYALVFDSPTIHSFTITLTAENWAKMLSSEPERGPIGRPPGPMDLDFEYVRATVRCGDEVYRDVALRFKGHSSYRGAGPDSIRKPYKIDFDRFADGQNFHGFRKLNFSNAFKDPSLLREKLAYDLFAKADVAAPRASFAKIYLTVEGKFENEYAGLYTLVEQVDSVFLKDRYGNSKGLLVKVETLEDLPDRGENWALYERDFELERGDTSDTAALIQFVRFLHEASDEQFAAEIEQRLNVESFLAELAVNTLLSNLDSYAGTGHNFYLYHNPTTKRFEFIPWDLNEAFGNFAMGGPDDMMDLDIYRPFAGKRVLIERLLKIEKHREQYRAILKQLIEGAFDPTQMAAEMDRLHALIRPDALADLKKPYSNDDFQRSLTEHIGGGGPRGLRRPEPPPGQPDRPGAPEKPALVPRGGPPGFVAIGLKPFVQKRVEAVRDQLAFKRRGYMIFDWGGPPRPPRPGLPPGPPFGPGEFLPPSPGPGR